MPRDISPGAAKFLEQADPLTVFAAKRDLEEAGTFSIPNLVKEVHKRTVIADERKRNQPRRFSDSQKWDAAIDSTRQGTGLGYEPSAEMVYWKIVPGQKPEPDKEEQECDSGSGSGQSSQSGGKTGSKSPQEAKKQNDDYKNQKQERKLDDKKKDSNQESKGDQQDKQDNKQQAGQSNQGQKDKPKDQKKEEQKPQASSKDKEDIPDKEEGEELLWSIGDEFCKVEWSLDEEAIIQPTYETFVKDIVSEIFSADLASSSMDYTWSKPNPLSFGRVKMPKLQPLSKKELVIAIDCSGSMSNTWIEKAEDFAESVIAIMPQTMIHVIFVNGGIADVQHLAPGSARIKRVQACGGTELEEAVKWTNNNAPKSSGLIVISDLENHWHGVQPLGRYSLFWVGVSKQHFDYHKKNGTGPKLGKMVYVDVDRPSTSKQKVME